MNGKISAIDQAANFYNSGRYSEARELLERAAKTNPDDAKVLSLLAGSLAALGEIELAFQKIERAHQLKPNVAIVQVLSGHVHSRANQPEKAEHHLRQANNLMPDHPVTLYSLGHNLLAQSRYN